MPLAGLGTGLGASAGSLLGGTLGQVGSLLDAPRRFLWKDILGGPETGTDVLAGLGMDPESGLTQGLGMGLEMLGDPLTWAGAGLGGRVGHFVGRAADTLAGRTAAQAALRAELPVAERLGQAAQKASMTSSPLEQALQQATYHPEVLAELPDVVTGAKAFKRANPAVTQLATDMGIGHPLPGGGLSALQQPSFAGPRGGLIRRPGEKIVPGGLPGGYESSLKLPYGYDLAAMKPEEIARQLQPVPRTAAEMPKMSDVLGELEAGAVQKAYPALGQQDLEHKLIQNILSTDLQSQQLGPFTHITDLPADRAFQIAQQRAGDIRQQLATMAAGKDMGVVQRLLARLRGM